MFILMFILPARCCEEEFLAHQYHTTDLNVFFISVQEKHQIITIALN